MFKIKKKFALTAGLASTLLLASAPVAVHAEINENNVILEINNNEVMNFHAKMTNVSLVNTDIADLQVIDDHTLNIIAKNSGTTALNVWTADGMLQTFMITVSQEDSYTARLISEAIRAQGISGVTVKKIANSVVLTGTVENQYERDLAAKTALLYALKDNTLSYKVEGPEGVTGGNAGQQTITVSEDVIEADNIINMLELRNPDQINISALVIEIDSNEAKDIGIKYGSSDPDGSPGLYYAGETYGQQRDPGNGWFSRSWLFTHFSQINARIGLAIENGKARVISQPNITTMSGEEAAIHVGGKIIVPVTNANGSTSTEEKPYGIDLTLVKPVLDRQGNITSTVRTSVSEIDWSNMVGDIPSMKERSAATVVNIPSGMTMVIGGLMNSQDGETVNKVPLLGNIPIIGELFKYHDTTHNDSEIMILITPRAVNEHTPVRVSQKMQNLYDDTRRAEMKDPHIDPNDPPGPTEEEKKAAEKAAKEAAKANREGKMLKLNDAALGSAEAEDEAAKAEKAAPPVAVENTQSNKVAAAETVQDNSVMGRFLNRRVLKDAK